MKTQEPVLVIFDCDGTLVDSQHMIVKAMTQTFEEAGLVAPSRHEILSGVGLSLHEAIARLVPGAEPSGVEQLTEIYKRAFWRIRETFESRELLYPGHGTPSSDLDATIGSCSASRRAGHGVGLTICFDRKSLRQGF